MNSPSMCRLSRRAVVVTLLTAATFLPLAAQGRLVGYRTSAAGPVYEHWSFSDGVYQPTTSGSDSVLVESAFQFSVPITLTAPVGDRWSVDLSTGYAAGRVNLAGNDSALNVARYSLSGLTDLRLRATGKLSEAVIVTVGLNLPTGKADLDEEEFNALRVLAAPALSFQVPSLGTGFAGTGGVVLARQLGAWAWALGASYEVRGGYSPGAVASGLFIDGFNPSDAFRVSLGADRLIGPHGMTVGLSADFYTKDRLTAGSVIEPGGQQAEIVTQLGPVLTLDWQLRIATARFRELTLYAVDRYRTRFKRGGDKVEGSSGNYLDAGVRSVLPLSSSAGLMASLNFRHQTGLDVDNTFSTAGLVGAAATIGVLKNVGQYYTVQPFVRGQVGRLESGEQSTTVTGFAGGVTLGLRF